MEYRKPTKEEERLLDFLIAKSVGLQIPADWKNSLKVEEMTDGGMGSLRLFPSNASEEKRSFGRRASDCQFKDTDDVLVIASLNVDYQERLLELDLWKTDFSRLHHIPGRFENTPS